MSGYQELVEKVQEGLCWSKDGYVWIVCGNGEVKFQFERDELCAHFSPYEVEETQTPPLELWEADGGPGCYRRAVPGGWVLTERDYGVAMSAVYIPDPTAPHCAPAAATDERPPMTDDELHEWCVKHCRQMRDGDDGRTYVMDDGRRVFANRAGKWCIEYQAGLTDASIIGPALWAAHKWGAA